MITRKLMAFIRRDFIIDTSYKFAFISQALSSVLPVVTFYFIGKLVGSGGDGSLARYGTGYFPFALVGVAFGQYLMHALRSFGTTIRRSQMTGCLEAMLNTRTRPEVTIMLSASYSFLARTLHIVMVLALGGLLFGVDFSAMNVGAAILTLLLTVAAFCGMGILSAALIIVLKKGDPVDWILGSLSTLIGGAYFPVEVMPQWLQAVSRVLPMRYALDCMRLALLRGYGVGDLWRQMGVLAGMAIVMLPLGIWACHYAVDKGRREGTLMQY